MVAEPPTPLSKSSHSWQFSWRRAGQTTPSAVETFAGFFAVAIVQSIIFKEGCEGHRRPLFSHCPQTGQASSHYLSIPVSCKLVLTHISLQQKDPPWLFVADRSRSDCLAVHQPFSRLIRVWDRCCGLECWICTKENLLNEVAAFTTLIWMSFTWPVSWVSALVYAQLLWMRAQRISRLQNISYTRPIFVLAGLHDQKSPYG
jgi:hypothetical protein